MSEVEIGKPTGSRLYAPLPGWLAEALLHNCPCRWFAARILPLLRRN